jgi:predicted ATPase
MDFPERFTIAKSKLYGRDKEIETLLNIFERVQRTRKSELLLVSGYSGVGKSSLINEIQRPITMQRSYYITGKFDQLTTVAYGAFVSAFQSLIKQLLAESKDRIAVWKEKLLEALQNNGKIIANVIPELELLIGIQPPVLELGGQEAKNRFDMVFKNFVSVFTESKAIVIFLDDIQVWFYFVN